MAYYCPLSSTGENLADMLQLCLPVALRHIPDRIRDTATRLDLRCALVGGVARDLLRIKYGQLEKEQFSEWLLDFDLSVENDGVRFAHELVRRLPGQLRINAPFKTATLTTEDGISIDIATSRNEHYAAPGQLPEVDTFEVSLEQDQQRRDFSVNAVAIELGDNHGQLIDTLGGEGDIRDRLIRVLHGGSFYDDPTRLMRAIRYGIRFGYDLEPVTLSLFSGAVDDSFADLLTPERIRYELECIGKEERWMDMWAVMDLSGLARALSAQLGGISRNWQGEDARSVDITLRNHAKLLEPEGLEPWLIRTAWVLREVPAPLVSKTAERIGLFARHIKTITNARLLLRQEWVKLAQHLRPSQVTRVLENYAPAAIVVAMFTADSGTEEAILARSNMLRYLEEYSSVRSELSGHELMELGAEQGRMLRELRDELRYLRLDGIVVDRENEINFASKLIRKHGGPAPEAAEEDNTPS
jgi:tRNA nucleotidyltransferase (CCA-adding enzyme)